MTPGVGRVRVGTVGVWTVGPPTDRTTRADGVNPAGNAGERIWSEGKMPKAKASRSPKKKGDRRYWYELPRQLRLIRRVERLLRISEGKPSCATLRTRTRSGKMTKNAQDWQAKYGTRPNAGTEVRQGHDGVIREYCGRCRWGWPLGTKPKDQPHQSGCPNTQRLQFNKVGQ